jgi:hypothetical protein
MIRRLSTAALSLLLLTACPRPHATAPDRAAPLSIDERPTRSLPLPEHLANLAPVLTALHNRERALVRAPPLAWDPRLAAAAAAYGPALARHGRLVHAVPTARPGQGENLWMGSFDKYGLTAMFEAWAREKRFFRPGAIPTISSTGKFADVGHYSQIIWRGTQRVGCAVHRTAAWDYLICRYAPAGNVMGRRVP